MSSVLIIEDHPDNLRLMTCTLRHAGYEVIAATTGEEGVRLALEENLEFIITDINLPDMDGYEVTRRIRCSPSRGEIPIIAVTSRAMAGDREHILACGCTGYFEKPVDPITLVQQIRDLLAAAGHPRE